MAHEAETFRKEADRAAEALIDEVLARRDRMAAALAESDAQNQTHNASLARAGERLIEAGELIRAAFGSDDDAERTETVWIDEPATGLISREVRIPRARSSDTGRSSSRPSTDNRERR